MLSSFYQLKENFQLRRSGVFKFQPKAQFKLEFGPYVLKTAESHFELIESFRLRNEIFNNEFRGLNRTGLDFDQFDTTFDHLLIIHTETQRVVGTYRVNCSNDPMTAYTALEFHMQNILRFEGPYLELGRACIHKDHRRGAVISLLWRGIAEYMKITGAQVLFGCSSLKVNDSRRAALVYRYLQDQGAVINDGCIPQDEFTFEGFKTWMHYFRNELTLAQIEEAQEAIPSLLKSYLKLGAKIFAPPAFDQDFDCLDFLTVLKRTELSASIDRKFGVNG